MKDTLKRAERCDEAMEWRDDENIVPTHELYEWQRMERKAFQRAIHQEYLFAARVAATLSASLFSC